MATKSRDAETVVLAEAILRELERRREAGGDSYPPRLRELGRAADGSASDDQIIKAAAKTAFTKVAVVLEKVGRKPSLESAVCGKKEKDQVEALLLARRMVTVLEANRELAGGAYPLTLRRLLQLCSAQATEKRVKKAVEHPLWADAVVVVGKLGKKPDPDSPLIHKLDWAAAGTRFLKDILAFALGKVVAGKGKVSTAFSLADLKKRLVVDLQQPMTTVLERGMKQGGLPDGVSWIWAGGKPYFFLFENLAGGRGPTFGGSVSGDHHSAHTAAPLNAAASTEGQEFAGLFREAFGRINQRNGGTNFVKLFDLRRELVHFTPEAFEQGLRELRLGREFTLNSHEGVAGTLTTEEREAGIRESGSLLVYVSRSS